MTEKQSKGKLKTIAIALVVVGVVLIVISTVYVFRSYPVEVVLNKGMVDVEDLPEPGLLPQSINSSQGTTEEVAWETSTSSDSGTLDRLGTIKIPAMQLSENIIEGSGNELLYAVGHIPGTAALGQPGNCALAGHRNYIKMHPFRFMDKLSVGDLVYVTDDKYQYIYEIFDIITVNADDSWVLDDQGEDEAILTLVTCTPVLNPVNRLIAWGELVDTTPLADQA